MPIANRSQPAFLAAAHDPAPAGGLRGRAFGSVALLVVMVGLAGCATKGDIRTLQTDIRALQLRQDSLFNETQRQTRLLLDTLRSSFAVQQDVRGETSHRFQQLEENLVQLEAMINQSQILTTQLLDRLDRAASPQASAEGGFAPEADQPPAGQAEEMYAAAIEKIGEGSYGTARIALLQIVEEFPNDPRAPYAQYQLAELHYIEGDHDGAIAEFEKLERQWPRSPRAPDALLRAGVIAQEQRQNEKARGLFRAVVERFPASEAASEARRRLTETSG